MGSFPALKPYSEIASQDHPFPAHRTLPGRTRVTEQLSRSTVKWPSRSD
jgi:hypothetical protein